MNVSAFLDVGFVEYEDIFESIVSGKSVFDKLPGPALVALSECRSVQVQVA